MVKIGHRDEVRGPRGAGFQGEQDVIARQFAAVLRNQGGVAPQIKSQSAGEAFETGQLRLRRQ